MCYQSAHATECLTTYCTAIRAFTTMYITGISAFSTVYLKFFIQRTLMFSLDWWKWCSFWNFILYIYGLLNFNTDFFSSINITRYTCFTAGISFTFHKIHAVLGFRLYYWNCPWLLILFFCHIGDHFSFFTKYFISINNRCYTCLVRWTRFTFQ